LSQQKVPQATAAGRVDRAGASYVSGTLNNVYIRQCILCCRLPDRAIYSSRSPANILGQVTADRHWKLIRLHCYNVPDACDIQIDAEAFELVYKVSPRLQQQVRQYLDYAKRLCQVDQIHFQCLQFLVWTLPTHGYCDLVDGRGGCDNFVISSTITTSF
jgi:hypothetical protein